MAIKITDECINCGACEPECPNNAIYDAGAAWRFSDGTALKGVIDFGDGVTLDAGEAQSAISDEFYYIVSDKYCLLRHLKHTLTRRAPGLCRRVYAGPCQF